MKKNIKVIILIILVMFILISLMIFKLRYINYNEILKYSNKYYEFNLNYVQNEEEKNYFGKYFPDNKITSLTDESETNFDTKFNLYELMASELKNKIYKENEKILIEINFATLIKNNPDLQSIMNEKTNMMCEYELFEKKIYSIKCSNDNDLLIMDFYF